MKNQKNKTIIKELFIFWKNKGIEINNGCSEKQLEEFEKNYKIKITGCLRDYFIILDGMKEDSIDDEFFSFWPLKKVKPISELNTNLLKSSKIPADSLFAFADYLMNSSIYGFAENSQNDYDVYLLGGRVPHKISTSFSTFLRKYMTNLKEIM